MFQFGGLGALFEGISLQKLSRGDGTGRGTGVKTVPPGKINLKYRPALSLYFGI